MISNLPWGEDNLVVVLATDLQRLERARFEFIERIGRMLRTTAEHREEQEKSLRDLNSMVMGIRPTTIPPRFLALEPGVGAIATRSAISRFTHLLDAQLMSRKTSL